MTAHVAERGEGRGRVVLRLTGSYGVSEHAIRAAVQVAKAFHSEIESLFVSDRQIFDAAGYVFVREIRTVSIGGADKERHVTGGGEALPGAPAGLVDVPTVARQIELAHRALQRRVGELANYEDVPVVGRQINDTPLGALARACQTTGPWNVVALGEPFNANSLARLNELFERVTGMTGVVLVGPHAEAVRGPVVAVIEDAERVPGMLRAAERLAGATTSSGVILAVAGEARSGQAWLKHEVGQAVSGHAVEVVELGRPGGGAAVMAEALRALGPSFVLAEHGGKLVPHCGDFRAMATALVCPLLVVR